MYHIYIHIHVTKSYITAFSVWAHLSVIVSSEMKHLLLSPHTMYCSGAVHTGQIYVHGIYAWETERRLCCIYQPSTSTFCILAHFWLKWCFFHISVSAVVISHDLISGLTYLIFLLGLFFVFLKGLVVEMFPVSCRCCIWILMKLWTVVCMSKSGM